jgi:excisionase family DNA binding protein
MFYTVTETARSLGLAPATVRVQIKLGKIAARRIGGRYYVFADEVERYRRESLGVRWSGPVQRRESPEVPS